MAILGAHVSIGGGIEHAPERGRTISADAIQIFTANQRQWQAKSISELSVQKFQDNVKKHGLAYCVSHASYLINLCAPDPDKYAKSLTSFTQELMRSDQLSIPYVVIHPGAHLGKGENWGVTRIAESIRQCYEQRTLTQVQIALETTAGQGTNIGYRFEQLQQIIEQLPDYSVGVCLDTAHVFSAGYDIRQSRGFEQVLREFEAVVGLDKLAVVHLNDSQKEFNSRKDRHANIGKGLLGLEPFEFIVRHELFQRIPCILETPVGSDLEYGPELELLRSLA
jgi:deoxyribonuclease-4